VSLTIHHETLAWPEAVLVASDRVSAGSPATSTYVLNGSDSTEAGLWKVTPGEFLTDHVGYVEVIYVLQGKGHLIPEAGDTINLTAGTAVVLEDGWRGRWHVEETLTKLYAITRTN